MTPNRSTSTVISCVLWAVVFGLLCAWVGHCQTSKKHMPSVIDNTPGDDVAISGTEKEARGNAFSVVIGADSRVLHGRYNYCVGEGACLTSKGDCVVDIRPLDFDGQLIVIMLTAEKRSLLIEALAIQEVHCGHNPRRHLPVVPTVEKF